jgi:hypothetical protein
MGRLLLAGPDLWVGLPSLGLERVSLEGGEGEVVAFSPGAWDVTVWDGELAVARGKAGISLLSPTAPGELLSTCDLPGRIRRVGVLDDRLVAASAGTLFVLER